MNDLAGKSFRQEQRPGRRRCSEKEIFDEDSLCNRHRYGDRNPDIPGHFGCADASGGSSAGSSGSAAGSPSAGSAGAGTQASPGCRQDLPIRRIEQFRRRSERRGELLQACIAACAGHQHRRHRTVVRRRHRQRCDHGHGKIGGIGNGYDGPAEERRRRDRRREQGGRSQDQEHLPRLLIFQIQSRRSEQNCPAASENSS